MPIYMTDFLTCVECLCFFFFFRDEAKKSSVDVSYLILCTQSSDIRYDTTLTLIC
jgi:hypothetical protein